MNQWISALVGIDLEGFPSIVSLAMVHEWAKAHRVLWIIPWKPLS